MFDDAYYLATHEKSAGNMIKEFPPQSRRSSGYEEGEL